MSNSFKAQSTAVVVAVMALVLAGIALLSVAGVSSAVRDLANSQGGSVNETQQTNFDNGLKVADDLILDGTSGSPVLNLGTNGTNISSLIEGRANAATAALPLEATSTDAFTLTVTGVTASDECTVVLPHYEPGVYGGLLVNGVTASAGTITFGIQNLTGAATSSFPIATTSVAYFCVQ